MMTFNVSEGGRAMGAWSRVLVQARASMAGRGDLWDAVQAMHAVQRADGMRRGASLCDYGDCGRAATHAWTRTAAELKAMRKGRAKAIPPMPVETHCEYHVPAWRTASYVRIEAPARAAKVA